MGCLAEDDLYELTRGRGLAGSPEVEAHLADCAACSALLAVLVSGHGAEGDGDARAWGALVGRTLGPYRLEAQIGAGGMGAVYRAVDERLKRSVAIKVLPAHAAHAPERSRRLEVEARAAAAIAHRNVVTIFDVGVADGMTYVVQELVDGETLRSVLARGPLPRARAAVLAQELAEGLAAAHAQGVVHRDLKPENLLVTGDGTLKILDFGLAKLAGETSLDDTEPGTIQGTAGYMAPEQARGEAADARCDLFAAGAILFELLAGRRAFDGASHADRMTAVLRDTPRLDDATYGPIVERCLDKDPRRRFQSALDLAWVLRRAAPAPAPPARARTVTRRELLVGAAAALAGAAAGRFVPRPRGPRGVPEATLRQLTYRQGRVLTARFGPDGRTVVFGAAWDGAPTAAFVQRTDAGLARALELPSADVLAVSARGEVAVLLGRRHVNGQLAVGQLAVLPLEGGQPRPLDAEIQDADFLPDGSGLILSRPLADGFAIEEQGGRRLYTTPGWITHTRVSPDGRRLACLVHPSIHDDRGELVVLDRDGGHARTLSRDWDSLAGLAWRPDGGALWFTAARGGASSALRQVTLDGEEQLVLQTTGRLRVHDAVAGGHLILTRDAWRLRTLVSDGHVDTDVSLTEFSMVTDVTADGSVLLVGEFGDVEGVNGCYLVPASGAPPLRLGAGLPRAVAPDGSQIAATPFGPGPPLHLLSARSADRPPLRLGGLVQVSAARFVEPGRLVVAGREEGRAARLWLVDATAAPRPLTDEGSAGPLELDATRRRAAFLDATGRLTLVSIDGGGARVLPGSLPRHSVCAWLQDGAIVVRSHGSDVVLQRVAAESGSLGPLRQLAPPPVGLKGVDSVVLSPDGTRCAYSYGQELSQLYAVTIAAEDGQPPVASR